MESPSIPSTSTPPSSSFAPSLTPISHLSNSDLIQKFIVSDSAFLLTRETRIRRLANDLMMLRSFYLVIGTTHPDAHLKLHQEKDMFELFLAVTIEYGQFIDLHRDGVYGIKSIEPIEDFMNMKFCTSNYIYTEKTVNIVQLMLSLACEVFSFYQSQSLTQLETVFLPRWAQTMRKVSEFRAFENNKRNLPVMNSVMISREFNVLSNCFYATMAIRKASVLIGAPKTEIQLVGEALNWTKRFLDVIHMAYYEAQYIYMICPDERQSRFILPFVIMSMVKGFEQVEIIRNIAFHISSPILCTETNNNHVDLGVSEHEIAIYRNNRDWKTLCGFYDPSIVFENTPTEPKLRFISQTLSSDDLLTTETVIQYGNNIRLLVLYPSSVTQLLEFCRVKLEYCSVFYDHIHEELNIYKIVGAAAAHQWEIVEKTYKNLIKMYKEREKWDYDLMFSIHSAYAKALMLRYIVEKDEFNKKIKLEEQNNRAAVISDEKIFMVDTQSLTRNILLRRILDALNRALICVCKQSSQQQVLQPFFRAKDLLLEANCRELIATTLFWIATDGDNSFRSWILDLHKKVLVSSTTTTSTSTDPSVQVNDLSLKNARTILLDSFSFLEKARCQIQLTLDIISKQENLAGNQCYQSNAIKTEIEKYQYEYSIFLGLLNSVSPK